MLEADKHFQPHPPDCDHVHAQSQLSSPHERAPTLSAHHNSEESEEFEYDSYFVEDNSELHSRLSHPVVQDTAPKQGYHTHDTSAKKADDLPKQEISTASKPRLTSQNPIELQKTRNQNLTDSKHQHSEQLKHAPSESIMSLSVTIQHS